MGALFALVTPITAIKKDQPLPQDSTEETKGIEFEENIIPIPSEDSLESQGDTPTILLS